MLEIIMGFVQESTYKPMNTIVILPCVAIVNLVITAFSVPLDQKELYKALVIAISGHILKILLF